MKLRFATCAVAVLLAGSAVAQEATEILPDQIDAGEVSEESGWKYRLSLGANINFGSSSNVIGAADGSTWTVGAILDSGAFLEEGNHEWRNTLLLSETFSRTPVVDEFVKSADSLEIESLYLFHVPSAVWFGPFARLTIDTAIFPGRDVRGSDTTYVSTFLDGTTETVTATSLELTDPFQPLALSESVGFFLEPIKTDELTYEFLAGFGAQELFASGQLTVADDDTTPEVEVTELDDHNLAGLAAVTSLYGSFDEGRLTYDLGGEALIPFINDLPANDTRSAVDIANIQFFAGLSFQMVEWASVDYRFQAERQPLLLDEWQLQHALLLSFSYTFIDEIEEEA